MKKIKGIITTCDPELVDDIQRLYSDWFVFISPQSKLVQFWLAPVDNFYTI